MHERQCQKYIVKWGFCKKNELWNKINIYDIPISHIAQVVIESIRVVEYGGVVRALIGRELVIVKGRIVGMGRAWCMVYSSNF